MRFKRILVTGQSGFIGKNLVNSLLHQGNMVYSICREIPPKQHPNILYIKHDLMNRLDVSALPDKIDYIFHIASVINHREYKLSEEAQLEINLESTKQLLDYGRQVGIHKFIFTSTGSVCMYRSHKIRESDEFSSGNTYVLSKQLSEKAIEKYGLYFKYIILRLFFPYGPKQNGNRLIPRLFNNIKSEREIIIHNGQNPIINPVHITDIINSISHIYESFDGVINVAGKEYISIKQLAKKIGILVKKSPIFLNKKDLTIKNIIGDISLLHKLGYEHKVDLNAGLEDILCSM